jgi:hypothetical protein
MKLVNKMVPKREGGIRRDRNAKDRKISSL